MDNIRFYLFFGCLILLASSCYAQQKNICISEELSNNSDKLKVKLGTKWPNRIWNFKFGDYKVVESKTGWKTSKEKSNFLGTKAETEIKYEFAFRLTNKLADTAIVKANKNVSVGEIRSFELFDGFFIGNDEVLNQTSFFLSNIRLSNQKESVWTLVLAKSYHKDLDSEEMAYLQNELRTITIAEVSSRECSGDKQRFPALGFEFIENDQAIGAVQYSGKGAFGYNKNMVWLKSDLDENSKLVLASAMAALMEIRGPDYLEQMYFGNDNED